MEEILYIVVPCYNEEEVLPETSRRLREKLQALADIGVDYISSGALTHSAPILDISMKNLHAL